MEFHKELFGYVDLLWMNYCLFLRVTMTKSEEDPGILENWYQYAKRNRQIAAP